MNIARAQKVLLNRLGGAGTAVLVVLLTLPEVPSWADGADQDGRAVVLVGKHFLGETEQAADVTQLILDSIKAGGVPDGCHAVAYAPRASAFIAEVVSGESKEVLADGPRNSGKTQAVPAALAILAELHARAGFALPLRVLWLHDSLVSAGMKTARSLEAPMWSGIWSIRDDRRVAALTVGGRETVLGDFVGVRDERSSDRLRAECHVVVAEELIPSLDENGGIGEREYELSLSSMRLDTRRKVGASVTNPGDQECWPHKRWIDGGGRPGCVRCEIPASDRMTPEEITAQEESFRESPDLQKRLAKGLWVALQLGEVVAVGFRPELHVAPQRLDPVPGFPFVMGHDAGLTPVTIIAQEVRGEIRCLGSLVSVRAGTRQHLEAEVLPWIATRAPWLPGQAMTMLIHHYDISMETPDESNLESSPIRVLRSVLGGTTYPGAVSWPGRRDPVLTLFTRLNPFTGRAVLQLCPEGCRPLIAALNGRWHYPTVNGQVSRELPAKTHPASDLGDAFCYLVGGLTPRVQLGPPPEIKVEMDFDPRISLAFVGR